MPVKWETISKSVGLTHILLLRNKLSQLFARDFNSANLEQKYFAGLKFRESSTLEFGF